MPPHIRLFYRAGNCSFSARGNYEGKLVWILPRNWSGEVGSIREGKVRSGRGKAHRKSRELRARTTSGVWPGENEPSPRRPTGGEVKPGQTVSGPGLCGSTLPCQRLRDNVSSGHQVSASSFQPSTNPTSLNSPGGIPCCPSGAPCPVAGAKAVSGEDGQRLIEKTPTFNARVRSFTSRRPFCTQPKRECTLQDAGFFPLYSQ
ncbi:hypothetical protein Bbelb_428730 [Branchiostoma belcheri]|nr:hypothetical protein Bbelb_428730 [Branchiostoma belcheri]